LLKALAYAAHSADPDWVIYAHDIFKNSSHKTQRELPMAQIS